MEIKKGRDWCGVLLAAVILSTRINAEKEKRQIFREQVLPALGGKIPEEAFKTDRLALNRLNKEGITVPDGVVLDARHVHKHPHPDERTPEIIKVYLTPDGRYVPPEGRLHYNHPKSVDTTYIIRRPYTHTNHYKSLNVLGGVKYRSYPKSQVYSNYRQVRPIVSSPVKSGVYEPVVASLIFPSDKSLFDSPTWSTSYDWDTVYTPFDHYFLDDIALFDSHQVIADYQGFINEYHQRSLRHVASTSGDSNRLYRKSLYQKSRSNIVSTHTSAYTSLTSIPETNFSCRGREGMFADVETKCQVFHNCSGWSRTSSLCPSGTAFCQTNKRCEWFNAVQCE